MLGQSNSQKADSLFDSGFFNSCLTTQDQWWKMLRNFVNSTFGKFGYKVVRNKVEDIYPSQFLDEYGRITEYSMVDLPGAFVLWNAVEHVCRSSIVGALVECGVWRGGMSILMRRRAQLLEGSLLRPQFLYDTFEGMSKPSDLDTDKHGNQAASLLQSANRKSQVDNVWAYASLNDVKANFEVNGLKSQDNQLQFIVGKVEDTIPSTIPESIALLRLDTDWYESTRHELVHLYPKVSRGGILLIDDYGYWNGCRKAVDEYFASVNPRPFFVSLPDGALVGVKP